MWKPGISWLPLALLVQPLAAEITLAPLFQSGGVLQRDKPLPVWGRATAGKTISVSFGGQTKSATADAAGRWQITLDALPASFENRTLTATEDGLPPVEVTDLWVGEVWLASGQSNMQWEIRQSRPEDQSLANEGPVPLLRLFDVPRTLSHTRQSEVDSRWQPATPETAQKFSAVAYFFGKQLAEELKIPVGMIHSSWGGARIEPWFAEEGLEGIPELEALRRDRLARSPGFPEYDGPFRRHIDDVRKWADAAAKAMDEGNPAPEMPAKPAVLALGHNQETGTYQSMIHPLTPYALRGFLWYQGESNNGEGMVYTAKMKGLIAGWRKQFRAPEAPFLYVQLAPYNFGGNRNFDLPGIWWAQQKALEIPHTGMAVTNDIGNVRDIHPTHKSEVARRLARWALADTYGQTGLVKSGPLFKEFRVQDNTIEVRFDHAEGLLTRDGQAPNWFEIAGVDGNYRPTTARISADRKSVLLTSDQVPQPDRVRFAWSQVAEPNLTNAAGLPAAAFNSHWPIDPSLGKVISTGKPFESSHPNTHGWNSGLTDGAWGNSSPTCYATSEDPAFPKTATVDLGSVQEVAAILYGTPDVGATKTVAVSVSEDGVNFREMGCTDFPAKKASRAEARFAPVKARFIRATFVENYQAQDNYSPRFAFLSELQVHAPASSN